MNAFMKKNTAIIPKTAPVIPLTSLGESIMFAGVLVVIMASVTRSAAKSMTIIPNTR